MEINEEVSEDEKGFYLLRLSDSWKKWEPSFYYFDLFQLTWKATISSSISGNSGHFAQRNQNRKVQLISIYEERIYDLKFKAFLEIFNNGILNSRGRTSYHIVQSQ